MSPKRSLSWVVMLAALQMTPIAFSADNQQQEVWRQRLITEAVPSWERLKASMPSISGSVIHTYWYHTDDPKDPEFGHDVYVKSIGQFWLTNGAERYVCDGYDKSGWVQASVSCSNPDYSFIQNKMVQTDEFATTQYGSDAEVSNSVRQRLDRMRWCMIPYNGYVDGSLVERVKSDRSHIVAWDEISRDGRKLVQVGLDYPPSPTAAVWDPSLRRTQLILDPQADWRVVSDHMSCDKISTDLDVTYDPNGPEAGRVSKVQLVLHEPHRNLDNMETVEFSSLSYAPIPIDDRFYLPEHPRFNPSANTANKSERNPSALDASWLNIGNAVYFVFAILAVLICWRMIRRRSTGI